MIRKTKVCQFTGLQDPRPLDLDLREPLGLAVQNDRLVQEARYVLQVAGDHRFRFLKKKNR